MAVALAKRAEKIAGMVNRAYVFKYLGKIIVKKAMGSVDVRVITLPDIDGWNPPVRSLYPAYYYLSSDRFPTSFNQKVVESSAPPFYVVKKKDYTPPSFAVWPRIVQVGSLTPVRESSEKKLVLPCLKVDRRSVRGDPLCAPSDFGYYHWVDRGYPGSDLLYWSNYGETWVPGNGFEEEYVITLYDGIGGDVLNTYISSATLNEFGDIYNYYRHNEVNYNYVNLLPSYISNSKGASMMWIESAASLIMDEEYHTYADDSIVAHVSCTHTLRSVSYNAEGERSETTVVIGGADMACDAHQRVISYNSSFDSNPYSGFLDSIHYPSALLLADGSIGLAVQRSVFPAAFFIGQPVISRYPYWETIAHGMWWMCPQPGDEINFYIVKGEHKSPALRLHTEYHTAAVFYQSRQAYTELVSRGIALAVPTNIRGECVLGLLVTHNEEAIYINFSVSEPNMAHPYDHTGRIDWFRGWTNYGSYLRGACGAAGTTRTVVPLSERNPHVYAVASDNGEYSLFEIFPSDFDDDDPRKKEVSAFLGGDKFYEDFATFGGGSSRFVGGDAIKEDTPGYSEILAKPYPFLCLWTPDQPESPA